MVVVRGSGGIRLLFVVMRMMSIEEEIIVMSVS